MNALDAQAQFTTSVSEIKFELEAEFGGGAVNPKIFADLVVNWDFAAANPQAAATSFGAAPIIELTNVRIDAGSVISSLIAPMIDKFAEIAEPLIEIVNGLNRQVFPNQDIVTLTYLDLIKLGSSTGGGDLGGWSTVLALLGDFSTGGNDDFAFIDTVVQVASFLGQAKSTSATGTIPLGSFKLSDVRGTAAGSNLSSLIQNALPQLNAKDLMEDIAPGLFQSAENFEKKDGSFVVDIVEDPMNAFKLLLGDESAQIFTFKLPTLNESFYKEYFFNAVIYVVPVTVNFKFGIGIEANVSGGLDGKGLTQFRQSGEVADILNGFYIDADPANPILKIRGRDSLDNDTDEILKIQAGIGFSQGFSFDLGDELGFDFGIAAYVTGIALGVEGSLTGADTNSGERGSISPWPADQTIASACRTSTTACNASLMSRVALIGMSAPLRNFPPESRSRSMPALPKCWEFASASGSTLRLSSKQSITLGPKTAAICSSSISPAIPAGRRRRSSPTRCWPHSFPAACCC